MLFAVGMADAFWGEEIDGDTWDREMKKARRLKEEGVGKVVGCGLMDDVPYALEEALQKMLKAIPVGEGNKVCVFEDQHECWYVQPAHLEVGESGEVFFANGEGRDVFMVGDGECAEWVVRTKGWTGAGGRAVNTDRLAIKIWVRDPEGEFVKVAKDVGVMGMIDALDSP